MEVEQEREQRLLPTATGIFYRDGIHSVGVDLQAEDDSLRAQFSAASGLGLSAAEMLGDAALVGGYLDGPETIRGTFVRTARQVAGLEQRAARGARSYSRGDCR